MRGVEIRHLQWKDVDLVAGVLDIRRSKTPAGWRAPTLNSICKESLSALRAQAIVADHAGPEHYLFPATVGGKLDPSRPAKSWRSAWRSVRRKAATEDDGEVIHPNLITVRFHDLRHTAITVMAEAGLPDQTIMAQVGHISPEMIKHYSHIGRQALNAAAAVLEPAFLKPQTTSAEMVN